MKEINLRCRDRKFFFSTIKDRLQQSIEGANIQLAMAAVFDRNIVIKAYLETIRKILN